MAKIYTGYFGKMKTYREAGLYPVAIAQYLPDWFNGSKYSPLAPMKYMLGKSMPVSEFDKEYKRYILEKLIPNQVFRQLEQLSKGQDIVLLCYEKLQKDCHRGLVAEWFIQNGIDVQEYGVVEDTAPKAVQLGLF